MSRFLISCGGTGGHLSPGISLAEGLAARGHEAVLLVSQKKVDARLLEKYPQLRFERLPGTGWSWHPVQALRFVVSQAKAFLRFRQIAREAHTDGIVGFGGFTSVSAAVAGRMLGIPVALHESNRVPGRTIRLGGRLAQRVYLPPGISIPAISEKMTRHVGLPVRREIVRHPVAAARAAFGLDPQRRTLVILGGSQGASALNDWVRTNCEALANEGVQVYCVTGLGKGREGAVELKTKNGETVRVVYAGFCDRMAELMSAADLVVSRAGAGTLAELIRCEAPAILVPYPQAADDHQRANAAFFEQQGAGIALAQPQLGELRAQVLALIGDEARLRTFRENLQRLDRANSLEFMLHDLEEIVAARGGPRDRPQPAAA